MISLKLPKSGYTVEIRDGLLWGEYKAIENFYQNNAKAQIVDGKTVSDFDCGVVQKHDELLIQTLLHSCRGIGNEEISPIGLIRTLDVEDGVFLENKIMKLYEEIKKKLGSVQ